jgi:hypothetical protein
MNKLIALILLTTATAFAGDWQTLFDGKTLDGWKTNPERGCWTVKDGLLTGMEDAEKLGSYLETVKEYKDFTFECEARWNDVADSGFMFRKEQRIHVNIGMSPSMKRDMTASLYLIKAGGYVAEAKVATLLKPGDWNKFKVELQGKKLTVWFNGEKVVEYEQDKFLEAGPIGLQCHKETPGMKVEFRHLRVMEL